MSRLKQKNNIFLLAIVLSLVLPNMSQAITYGGHDYALTSAPTNWFSAEGQAVAAGGHLVTINDAAEENWLKSTFGSVEFFWIGFTDRPVEGNWHWTSGEPVTYTNWAPVEPNDSQAYYYNGEQGEDCGQMNFVNAYGSGWNDLAGNQLYYGIIEASHPLPNPLPPIPPPPAPLPGSLLLLGSGLVGLLGLRRGLR